MASPLIRVDRVSHAFTTAAGATVRALEDVSLEIGENELVTIVGRSGCGKSTLLRIVAGLLAPTAGRVTIAGRPVSGPSPEVGLLFQTPALLPWRSVIGNVMLPAEILRLDKKAHRRVAEELLELVGLAGFAHSHPYELSGGMQQRVALCRALVHDPAVLLMDEPFAALDALTREELSLELQRLFMERRKTILFVTHSIQEAVLLADRVAVLTPRPGRLARIVEVDLPRPRSLGESTLSDELHRCTAELHDLLFTPDSAFESTPSVVDSMSAGR